MLYVERVLRDAVKDHRRPRWVEISWLRDSCVEQVASYSIRAFESRSNGPVGLGTCFFRNSLGAGGLNR